MNLDALNMQRENTQQVAHAVALAQQTLSKATDSLRDKKKDQAKAEKEEREFFLRSGGVIIYVEHGVDRVLQVSTPVVRIIKIFSANGNGFERSILARFNICTDQRGIKIARGEYAKFSRKAFAYIIMYSEKLFEYIVSLEVFPGDLAVVRFGDHYFEKTKKGWRKIN